MDCDPGHDDALAIMLAAAHPELEILGISTVYGNSNVESVTMNAIKICDLVALTSTKIFKGSSFPIIKKQEIAHSIHGKSGLDGPIFPEPSRTYCEEHGVDMIVREVNQSDKKVTIVATGPLTNIALSLSKSPEIGKNIEQIILMGGGTFGNWSPTAEFNIWADPEAAKKVFESNISLVVMGLDITHQVIATDSILKDIQCINNKVSNTAYELLSFFASTYKKEFGFKEGPPVHDALTIAYCIKPEMFTTKDVHIDIETKGEYTAGMTSVDLKGVTKKSANAKFGMYIDITSFWQLFINSLKKFSE